jgi:predicted RNase H-like HicB family nuclease
MPLQLTAVFQKVPEGYIGFVEELPGTNTQGATQDETRSNLTEAVDPVLEANRLLAQEASGARTSFGNRSVFRPLDVARPRSSPMCPE